MKKYEKEYEKMSEKSENRIQGKRWGKIAVLIGVIIILALLLQGAILNNVNNRNANKTSRVLLEQIISIIEKNGESEKELVRSLKEDYIVRAKAVSYIIDAKPSVENDVEELKKIANLMSIDEIHLFDTKGRIYSGTVPKYYGYSFESGSQMAYFKPMLKNKKLTMCQDVTPNTSEGKSMMYAMTWNEAGTRMVQVGIEPVRLIQKLKQNQVSTVVNNIPAYKGISIYVANQKSGVIYGATDKSKIGKTLDQIGIPKKRIDTSRAVTDEMAIDGKDYNCIFEKTGDYIVGVAFDATTNDDSNFIALLIVAVYLGLAVIGILVMISRAMKRKEEVAVLSHTSHTDELTGCFNRRAYEKDILKLSTETEFIYISMDVNGLKIVNDSRGHTAGDELLQGAAFCMKECFSDYGKVYRTGGDEFVTILFVAEEEFEKIKERFDEMVNGWSGEQIQSLTISYGSVFSNEQIWSSINEIAHVADTRMYEKKAMYYRQNGVDRRGQPAAYVTICKLYSKILKINLTKDKYRILNWTENEYESSKTEQTNLLSEWLQHPIKEGMIHPEDVEEYIEKSNLEHLIEYFDGGKKVLTISYRRKCDKEHENQEYKTPEYENRKYERVTLDIIPEDEYSEEKREGFLYMKVSE